MAFSKYYGGFETKGFKWVELEGPLLNADRAKKAYLLKAAEKRAASRVLKTGKQLFQESSRVDTGQMQAGWSIRGNALLNDVWHTQFNFYGTVKMSPIAAWQQIPELLEMDFVDEVEKEVGRVFDAGFLPG